MSPPGAAAVSLGREDMDWVELGSYLTVAVAVIIVVVLGIMGYRLIYKDGDKH